jgi:hypothetical protein
VELWKFLQAVVYRWSESDPPVVSERVAKRVIATAVGMFGDA